MPEVYDETTMPEQSSENTTEQNAGVVDLENSGNFIIDGKVVQGRPRGWRGARARRVATRQPLDFLPDTALGLKLPFNNPEGRLFDLNYLSMDQTLTNLKNLLLTRKGERVMHPNFGTRLQEALFEPNTETLRTYVNAEIEKAISFWLPYVLLQNVTVKVAEQPGAYPSMIDPMHGIQVSVTFSLKNNRIDTKTLILDIKAD